jgi:hypothetical protein
LTATPFPPAASPPAVPPASDIAASSRPGR